MRTLMGTMLRRALTTACALAFLGGLVRDIGDAAGSASKDETIAASNPPPEKPIA